ncbi:bifunctional indole-3-glycerol-phosphate synthase TrpC/phosphoribosylanthranilate isomerase TrpF [Alteromonas sp. C1M14]|uniref:bifunctional indole-3-glycerol-phosphate synthase TrpC/phosphoribosylanthranilate isomerase TrpF n=1 Tax=Alteromonas sp. C1M14 TaxID=2841567 RepID=UPI001C09FED9|nr:bifunctional indole-3-glycerol-phosphate synthase TrpC/phosphoribosylanthranilate isomerase TrpF [Alteromonas sp. C1M14]MBU2977479.1 bifunctional indole-3-glycerol-phosphate synthase TrpC/phosphoribosylanthranilate isomerase TrpF [Alteromonas sp. C1M14]
MSNVLTRIVDDKRIEVEARIADKPLSTFKDDLTPSTKSLFDALNEDNAGFIFECKKASPSKGLIRSAFDLDEILTAYSPYAAGISVLTDEKYFQGNYDYLSYVTARVSQPVLNKDFFINEYQVYLARYYQADAILLMLSVLDDATYSKLAAVADSLSLDILTEVSNEEEMHRAIALKAKIIGINNRNLRDLSTDLATTEQLVPLLEKATHDHVVISESGIYTHSDVRRLAPLCQGFLVGSALMAQENLSMAVRGLIYGDIKVCGLTRPQDARNAFNYGANYGGLIFTEKSKRYISVERAATIVDDVPGHYVGVFVNQPVDFVAKTAATLGLYAVQLHGNEDDLYRQDLKTKLPDTCQVWQALGVTSQLPDNLEALLSNPDIHRVLLDCQSGDAKGGTGQAFDWQLLAPLTNTEKLIIAGGIGPQNICQALSTKVATVDVNSGVEDAPGEKSAEKLAALFTQARRY